MAKAWATFPYADKKYQHNAASLKKAWERLHRGDAEPFPKDDAVVDAWIAFHAGDFQKAAELGVKAGSGAGINIANKAQSIYANYLEENDKRKLELFEEVAQRAEALQAKEPKNANAHYWQAYALGRYAQGISVAKALAQGIGGKVKAALETTIKLAPKHADAHTALGSYHAEVIDKVGAMIGGLTYGAKKDAALKNYQAALKLNPDSAIARIEYANGLVMLEGKKALKEAEKLYAEAAKCEPLDAMERLDVELAKSELED
jgi:tetratricopeptide (TPR) repeat protein